MNNSGVTYNLPGTVSAVFFTKKDADAAYDALLKRGHTADDISVLMSDETLSNHKAVYTLESFPEEQKEISRLEKTKDNIANAIISITSMISLPGLGIAISNKLFRKIQNADQVVIEESVGAVIGSTIPEEHTGMYGESMREGGIIISVDPRNADEKREIVKEFIEHNGHDILGDDGYTELG